MKYDSVWDASISILGPRVLESYSPIGSLAEEHGANRYSEVQANKGESRKL